MADSQDNTPSTSESREAERQFRPVKLAWLSLLWIPIFAAMLISLLADVDIPVETWFKVIAVMAIVDLSLAVQRRRIGLNRR